MRPKKWLKNWHSKNKKKKQKVIETNVLIKFAVKRNEGFYKSDEENGE